MKNTNVLRSPPRPPIPSNCTPAQLGEAMAAANLQSIEDPDQRARAFMDVLTRLMIGTVRDPETRHDIMESRMNAAMRGRSR